MLLDGLVSVVTTPVSASTLSPTACGWGREIRKMSCYHDLGVSPLLWQVSQTVKPSINNHDTITRS
jgi:hypothetical protein